MVDLFNELAVNPDCRVVVVSGAGKMFTAGKSHSVHSFTMIIVEPQYYPFFCVTVQVLTWKMWPATYYSQWAMTQPEFPGPSGKNSQSIKRRSPLLSGSDLKISTCTFF